ncbi:hypothetical protein [Spirosoma fluminis]
MDLLANKYYCREVYSFLSSNRVVHPDAFIQPLNQTIEQLSVDIKIDIESSDTLQFWSFDAYGTDHLLRAITSQFSVQIITFYPNVII